MPGNDDKRLSAVLLAGAALAVALVARRASSHVRGAFGTASLSRT